MKLTKKLTQPLVEDMPSGATIDCLFFNRSSKEYYLLLKSKVHSLYIGYWNKLEPANDVAVETMQDGSTRKVKFSHLLSDYELIIPNPATQSTNSAYIDSIHGQTCLERLV